ncbi:MAG TPA: hypothetical protein VHK69_18995 [Chitinophagaceae bacterium]|nr:hypothetical protein [Chitinophagaceae bacterium]
MNALHATGNSTRFFWNDREIIARYAFSRSVRMAGSGASTICLEIRFEIPSSGELTQLTVIKSGLILFQPLEVVEAIVHREIRSFFKCHSSTEFSTIESYLALT